MSQLATAPILKLGETILSYVQRIQILRNQPDCRQVNQLLGLDNSAHALLPKGLEKLAFMIGGISARDLLKDHTLYPLLQAFAGASYDYEHLDSPQTYNVIQKFRYSDRLSIKGVTLRRCSLCAAEDLYSHGITYWHREHQIPELTVCAAHGIDLEISCPICETAFISAGDASTPMVCRACNLEMPLRHAKPTSQRVSERRLACIAQNVLERFSAGFDSEAWVAAYDRGIGNLGLIKTHRGRPIAKLIALIEDRIGAEVLADFGATLKRLEKSSNSWVSRIFARIDHRPIYHLILIDCLYGSYDEFLCGLRRDRISDQVLSPVSVQSRNRGKSDAKQSETVNVELVAGHYRRGLTNPQLAVELRLSTVQIAELIKANRDLFDSEARKAIQREHRRTRYRGQADELRSKLPGMTQRMLMNKHHGCFVWLYKNDREWLDARFARYTKKRRVKREVKYPRRRSPTDVERDAALASRIEAAIAEIRVRNPVEQLSVSRIAEALHIPASRLYQLRKGAYVKATRILKKNVETASQFAIRRRASLRHAEFGQAVQLPSLRDAA